MMEHIPPEVFEIYHRNKAEYIDALKATILLECPYDVLPEVFDVFGTEAMKFLEIFAGRTIAIPSIKDIVTKLRQVAIYVGMGGLTAEDEKYDRMVDQIAARFNMRKNDVRQTVLNMQQLMDGMAMELRPKRDG